MKKSLGFGLFVSDVISGVGLGQGYGPQLQRLKNIFEMTKKISHFGQNVWKYKLMNAVTASFNTFTLGLI